MDEYVILGISELKKLNLPDRNDPSETVSVKGYEIFVGYEAEKVEGYAVAKENCKFFLTEAKHKELEPVIGMKIGILYNRWNKPVFSKIA